MASNSRLGLKIVVVLAVIGAASIAAVFSLRQVAKVARVVAGKAFEQVPGSVVVQAEYAMELKSEIGGRVVRSDLVPGNPVKQFDVLIQIDPGDLALEIEKYESEYDAAKKRVAVGSQIELDLETAKADLDNFERLNKLGNISDSDLSKQKRVVKQIEQKRDLEKVANDQLVQGLENTLKVKRRQMGKMTIAAPFDGVVDKVFARPGDLIGSNVTIATLISTSRTVEGRISEENFSGVRVGQKANVRFLGYGNKIYEATVAQILPTADPETQRYIVHLDVKIEPALLVPGITGEINIIVAERPAEAIVPRRAILGSSVLVVKDGLVEMRPVQRGFVSLTDVEILKGLNAGEEVIVEDLDRYRPGDRVRTQLVK